MRWARFTANGNTRYGLVEANRIQTVDGTPFGEHILTGNYHALESVKLEVPVIPPTFYCAGFNYLGHIKEHGKPWVVETSPRNPISAIGQSMRSLLMKRQ